MPRKGLNFTQEVRDQIVAMVACGNFFSTACALAGAYETTMQNYRHRGEAILRLEAMGVPMADQQLDEIDLACVDFYLKLKAAEGTAENICVQTWFGEGHENWKAAQGFLERRFKDKWAPSAAPDDEPVGERPKVVEVVEPEDDETPAPESDA